MALSDVKLVLNEVWELLNRKNKAYGDSINNPIRVFSKSSTDEQIKVRIDDKLSRIQSMGMDEDWEDTILDLIGYLVMLRARKYYGTSPLKEGEDYE